MWLYEPRSHRAASIADLERRFTRFATRRSPDGTEVWLNYAVRIMGGAYVGTMQATIVGSSSLIGYSIFADHWRQGYGKEASARLVRFLFEECGVRRVRATVDTENAASIALLERIGFHRTWTGPSDDMPGRRDHRYELQTPPALDGASPL
jgi:RimJ/RimL family protein N-acetyltransferase